MATVSVFSNEKSVAHSTVSLIDFFKLTVQVSQVEAKIKANQKKKVLKRLMKDIDLEKSGVVKDEAFFTILNLSGISLTTHEQSKLKKNFSKSGKTNYIPALQALTIDLDSAIINEEKWTSQHGDTHS